MGVQTKRTDERQVRGIGVLVIQVALISWLAAGAGSRDLRVLRELGGLSFSFDALEENRSAPTQNHISQDIPLLDEGRFKNNDP